MGLNLSVAMCTYNGERFLSPQLESIASQDRPPDELVVCDDGSSDDSCALITAFAARAPFPVRLIVNENNLGSTKNFEKAISLCPGEIVALADQDDVWYPQKLKCIEAAFERSTEIVAVFSDADLIDGDSRRLGIRLWRAFSFHRREQQRFSSGQALNILVKHPVVTGATMAFRKELFGVAAPIPPDEIHDQWISFLLATQGRIEIIREPLMQYRRHHAQQEGLPPQSRQGLLTQSRTRGASFHLEEIARFRQLHDWLGEHGSQLTRAEEAQIEIEKKISHLTKRAQLPRGRFSRVPTVLQETFNGGYWRYSAGWNSIAKDLVIL